MIPKKIHYCWFGKKPLPKEVIKCIKSWEKFCPDYEIIRWDETNFDIECSPFVKKAYSEKAWAFVSDYARLKIIYDSGGIYLDTDVELIKNLDFLLNNECYIGVQQNESLCNTGLGFGAIKGNSVVYEMLKEYDNITFNIERKLEIACPYLNSKVLARKGFIFSNEIQEVEGAVVYPPQYFDPLSPGEKMKNLYCEDTISIHHYSASWMSKRIRIKRKFVRMIGQDKASTFKRKLKYAWKKLFS